MSRAYFILLLSCLSIVRLTAQTKITIGDLEGLNWEYNKQYALLDSGLYFIYSFSVANVEQLDGNTSEYLDHCSCRTSGDTIKIFIHKISAEGGIAVAINLFGNSWDSYVQHYSDIPEFNNKFIRNYKPEHSTLYLNQPIYTIGDIMIGSIDLTALDIESLDSEKMRFKGKFQCVIMNNTGYSR